MTVFISVSGPGPRPRGGGFRAGGGFPACTCPARASAPVPARGRPGARAAGPARGPALKLSYLSLLPPRNPLDRSDSGPGAEMKIVLVIFSVKCQTGAPSGRAAPGEIFCRGMNSVLRLTSARSRKLAPGCGLWEVTNLNKINFKA